MQDFRDLLVWQKTHQLTLDVYRVTQRFPKHETYRLNAQMRSASVSIGSNICEGCGRGGWPELIQFCQIAFGSLSELEYQLLLARDLSYLDEHTYQELEARAIEVKRMLASFLATLRARSGKPRALARSRRISPPAPASTPTATDALTH
ncbi:MAG: four helix bundle protein [Chloroflexi bacterium]|nr:four helix bundle protein [Chloroflexota bacterium]